MEKVKRFEKVRDTVRNKDSSVGPPINERTTYSIRRKKTDPVMPTRSGHLWTRYHQIMRSISSRIFLHASDDKAEAADKA
jgi:hypothetical protein